MTPCTPTSVPAATYRAHQSEIDAAVADVFHLGRFILGDQTARFEKEFAAFLGATHCMGVASGTDALEIALRACGIGAGDAVLTVSHTAVATVAAIERAGASPVLVDIEPATFTMDPNRLETIITEYRAKPGASNHAPLKAVIPVHLYGQPADMPAILEVASRHGLRVIEDCAQSHGATLLGRMTGTWGDLAAFSFYPTKNLGAFGDGGAVVTSNPELGGRVRLLREYGWQTRQVSAIPGLNSRLDELQASILRVLLRYLAPENDRRRELARCYHSFMSQAGLLGPCTRPSAVHVFHQYVIRTPQRDDMKAFLETQGVATQIHYPMPIHCQPAYRQRLFIGRHGLPQTEAVTREILSLPMSPHMLPAQIEQVCEAIHRWLDRKHERP